MIDILNRFDIVTCELVFHDHKSIVNVRRKMMKMVKMMLKVFDNIILIKVISHLRKFSINFLLKT